MNGRLQAAIQLFDTPGVYGMTDVSDPETPFASFSKNKNQNDGYDPAGLFENQARSRAGANRGVIGHGIAGGALFPR
jgi:hypothetical protein